MLSSGGLGAVYFSSPVNGVAATPLEMPKKNVSPMGALAVDLDESLTVSESACPRRRLFSEDSAPPPNPFLFQTKPARPFTRVATCAARLERSKSPSCSPTRDGPLVSDDLHTSESLFSFKSIKPSITSFKSGFGVARPPLIPRKPHPLKPSPGQPGTSHWNQRRVGIAKPSAPPRSVLDITIDTSPPSQFSKKRDRPVDDDATAIGSPMNIDCDKGFSRSLSFSMVSSKKMVRPPPIKIRRTAEVCSPVTGCGGDGSKGELPHTVVERDALKRITPDTLKSLMDGGFSDICDEFHIIDCRYPYEYAGGHIRGAKNITQRPISPTHFNPPSVPTNRTIIVFHCEFSVQRAPRMALSLRNHDRNLNMDRYPFLDYPNVYILQGGYKEFFGEWWVMTHCTPQTYIEMKDERYKEDLKKYTSMLRTEFKRCYSTGFLRT
ncbi:Rhodanese-like domain-containing protein [Chytridium lagenaria]|nr:Rhodanese-like domain-containing protein [Chytridium lagenaria]